MHFGTRDSPSQLEDDSASVDPFSVEESNGSDKENPTYRCSSLRWETPKDWKKTHIISLKQLQRKFEWHNWMTQSYPLELSRFLEIVTSDDDDDDDFKMTVAAGMGRYGKHKNQKTF